MKKENKSQNDYIERLSADNGKLQADNTFLRQKYDEIETLNENITQHNEELKKKIIDLDKQKNNLIIENDNLKTQIKNKTNNNISNYELDINKYKSLLTLIENTLSNYVKNNNKNENQLNILNNIKIDNYNFKCISEIIKKCEEANHQTQYFQNEMNVINQQYQKKKEEMENALKSIINENKQYKNDCDLKIQEIQTNYEKQLKELQYNYDKITIENDDYITENKKLEQEKEELKDLIQELQDKLNGSYNNNNNNSFSTPPPPQKSQKSIINVPKSLIDQSDLINEITFEVDPLKQQQHQQQINQSNFDNNNTSIITTSSQDQLSPIENETEIMNIDNYNELINENKHLESQITQLQNILEKKDKESVNIIKSLKQKISELQDINHTNNKYKSNTTVNEVMDDISQSIMSFSETMPSILLDKTTDHIANYNKLQKDIQDLETENNELNMEIDSYKERIQELEEKVIELEENNGMIIEDKDVIINGLEEEIMSLQQFIEKLDQYKKNINKEQENEINKLKSNNQLLLNEKLNLTKKYNNLYNSYSELEKENETETKNNEILKDNINKLVENNKQLSKSLKEAELKEENSKETYGKSLNELENKVKEVAVILDSLEKEKAELEEKLNESDEIAKFKENELNDVKRMIIKNEEKIKLLQHENQLLKDETSQTQTFINDIINIEDENQSLKDTLQDKELQMTSYEIEIHQLEEKMKNEIDLKKKLETKIQQISDSKIELGNEINILKNTLKNLQNEYNKLSEEYQKILKEYEEFAKNHLDCKNVIDSLNNELEKTKSKTKEMKNLVEAFKRTITNINNKLSDTKKQNEEKINTLEIKLKETEAKSIEIQNNEVIKYKNMLIEKERQLIEINNNNEKLIKENSIINEKLNENISLNDSTMNLLNTLKQNNKDLIEKNSTLQSKIKDMKHEIDNLKQENTELVEQNDSLFYDNDEQITQLKNIIEKQKEIQNILNDDNKTLENTTISFHDLLRTLTEQLESNKQYYESKYNECKERCDMSMEELNNSKDNEIIEIQKRYNEVSTNYNTLSDAYQNSLNLINNINTQCKINQSNEIIPTIQSYQQDISKLQSENQKLVDLNNLYQTRCLDYERDRINLIHQISNQNPLNETEKEAIASQIENLLQLYQEEKSKMEGEKEKIKDDITIIFSELQKELEKRNCIIDEENNEIEKLQLENKQLIEQINNNQQNEVINNQQNYINQLERKLEEINKTNEKTDLDSKKKNETYENEKLNLRKEIELLRNTNTELHCEINNERQSVNKLKSQIEELNDQNRINNQKLQVYESEIVNLKEYIKDLKEENKYNNIEKGDNNEVNELMIFDEIEILNSKENINNEIIKTMENHVNEIETDMMLLKIRHKNDVEQYKAKISELNRYIDNHINKEEEEKEAMSFIAFLNTDIIEGEKVNSASNLSVISLRNEIELNIVESNVDIMTELPKLDIIINEDIDMKIDEMFVDEKINCSPVLLSYNDNYQHLEELDYERVLTNIELENISILAERNESEKELIQLITIHNEMNILNENPTSEKETNSSPVLLSCKMNESSIIMNEMEDLSIENGEDITFKYEELEKEKIVDDNIKLELSNSTIEIVDNPQLINTNGNIISIIQNENKHLSIRIEKNDIIENNEEMKMMKQSNIDLVNKEPEFDVINEKVDIISQTNLMISQNEIVSINNKKDEIINYMNNDTIDFTYSNSEIKEEKEKFEYSSNEDINIIHNESDNSKIYNQHIDIISEQIELKESIKYQIDIVNGKKEVDEMTIINNNNDNIDIINNEMKLSIEEEHIEIINETNNNSVVINNPIILKQEEEYVITKDELINIKEDDIQCVYKSEEMNLLVEDSNNNEIEFETININLDENVEMDVVMNNSLDIFTNENVLSLNNYKLSNSLQKDVNLSRIDQPILSNINEDIELTKMDNNRTDLLLYSEENQNIVFNGIDIETEPIELIINNQSDDIVIENQNEIKDIEMNIINDNLDIWNNNEKELKVETYPVETFQELEKDFVILNNENMLFLEKENDKLDISNHNKIDIINNDVELSKCENDSIIIICNNNDDETDLENNNNRPEMNIIIYERIDYVQSKVDLFNQQQEIISLVNEEEEESKRIDFERVDVENKAIELQATENAINMISEKVEMSFINIPESSFIINEELKQEVENLSIRNYDMINNHIITPELTVLNEIECIVNEGGSSKEENEIIQSNIITLSNNEELSITINSNDDNINITHNYEMIVIEYDTISLKTDIPSVTEKENGKLYIENPIIIPIQQDSLELSSYLTTSQYLDPELSVITNNSSNFIVIDSDQSQLLELQTVNFITPEINHYNVVINRNIESIVNNENSIINMPIISYTTPSIGTTPLSLTNEDRKSVV